MRGRVLGVAFFVATGAFASAALPAYPPSGFLRFCMEHAVDCSATPGGVSAVELTFERLGILEQINREVNTQIKPMNDAKHYGRAEFWTIPTDGYGDCEDYALTKRQRLMAAGFPSQSLLLAVVETPELGRHAVLTVTTNAGTLVLDNLEPAILKREETKYSWVEHEDSSNLLAWVDYSDKQPTKLDAQVILSFVPPPLADLSVAAISPSANTPSITFPANILISTELQPARKHHRRWYRTNRLSRRSASTSCVGTIAHRSGAGCRMPSVAATTKSWTPVMKAPVTMAPAAAKASQAEAHPITSFGYWFGHSARR